MVIDMNFILDFNANWYVLLGGFLAAWVLLTIFRGKLKIRREIKEQILLALGGMTSLALMEFFAVSTGLWSYTPGNWPVILWPTYFAAILFGYQLLRSIEGLLFHRSPII